MRRVALSVVALMLAIAGSAGAQDDAPASEEPATAPDPYQEAYDAASALAAQGEWREAAKKFREAVALRPTAVGLFNLNSGILAQLSPRQTEWPPWLGK